jgi:DegV family protein with EDD domain
MSNSANRIAVITDSTSDIPPDLAEELQIVVVPLYVVWGGADLLDGRDIDNESFYARLARDPEHPKTSQPPPSDFAYVIEETGAAEVVLITLSAKLSGTYDSAVGAVDMVNIPVHLFDSRSTTMGLGWQVIAAARARNQGASVPEILAEAERVRERISVLFTLDTLEYLHRVGRIGGAAKFLGTALQLKPMLTVDNITGFVDAVENTRTRKKALERIFDATFERVDPSQPTHVGVIQGGAREEAQALYDTIQARYHPAELTFSGISPIVGVHGGPGMVGICAYND